MIKTKISKLFKIRNANDLIQMPHVVTVNKFDDQAAKEFKIEIQKSEDTHQPVIPVIINSYGGEIYALLNMVDTIASCSKPVATIVLGKAMSCGAVLLTCGAEGMRYMGPNSTLMIHDCSSGTHGKVKDMAIDLAEAERLNKLIYKIMAKNCGKPEKYFYDIVKSKSHADWYMTPEEALSHNLTNHIKVPNFKVTCSVKIALE